MGGLVIALHIRKETAADLLKGMEIPHVKAGYPLVLHGTEPALDLLSECSDKRSYTKLFIIRIFFERYCLYDIFLKKDADKNTIPDQTVCGFPFLYFPTSFLFPLHLAGLLKEPPSSVLRRG